MPITGGIDHAFHLSHFSTINSRHSPVSTTFYAPDSDLNCTALSNRIVTELRDAPTSRAYISSSLRAAANPLHTLLFKN